MSALILLVDDDTLLRRTLSFNLEQAGYRVATAGTAENALDLAKREPPDLVLLDIGLPGMDGLDALRHFQGELNLPVILLTARRRELDEALGLELGADDYVTKPFDLNVLLARIKAALRRIQRSVLPTSPVEEILTIGDLTINPAAHSVLLRGEPLLLSPREFELLHALALKAGKVVSTDDLLSNVWGAEFYGQPQVVYVHIRWLREKIEPDPTNPERLITIRGVGYKLQPFPAGAKP